MLNRYAVNREQFIITSRTKILSIKISIDTKNSGYLGVIDFIIFCLSYDLSKPELYYTSIFKTYVFPWR